MMFPINQRPPRTNPRGQMRPVAPPRRPLGPPVNPYAKPISNPYKTGAFQKPFINGGPFQGGAPAVKSSEKKGVGNLTAMFQNPDGQFDIDKIMTTAQNIHKIYNDMSPMVSQFIKSK
ncbi:YppG family protein [Lentibacillus saliphilus]|uniref:YppG family protein n=1 Tax=Lentibacillus saliphilus TaxID=2737028 RepID=UPI001C30E4E0|nr:YppG family protein [Lentibacillus saliphilus]